MTASASGLGWCSGAVVGRRGAVAGPTHAHLVLETMPAVVMGVNGSSLRWLDDLLSTRGCCGGTVTSYNVTLSCTVQW
jgi:hypothetical protein